MVSKQYIVIGSSAAALGALRGIRSIDKDVRVSCITASEGLPFNTCLLVDYLSGRKERDALLKSPDFFEKNAIDYRPSTVCVGLDSSSNTVVLSDGSTLHFDRLFLGLGVSARKVPFSGKDHNHGVFYFHTLADTEAILQYINRYKVKHATIIGAGLSGVECADALVHRGIRVALIDMHDRVLASHVDTCGADVIESLMKRSGVTLHLNEKVDHIDNDDEHGKTVVLSGSTVKTDMVVVAAGSLPNSSILSHSGVELYNGRVKVDDYMMTSKPSLFAAGDLCVVKHRVTGEYIANTTWPDAVRQGMIAGMNMAGKRACYEGLLPWVSSQFFGISFASSGPVYGSGYEEIVKQETSFYHKFLLHNGELVGFVMVGNVTHVGQLRLMLTGKQQFDIRSFDYD